ncbi:MAG: cobalamin-binding protein [Chloroflexota bacterium]
MKIVTLLPSATEIACALGLRDSLVAVSHECDFPADVSALPTIASSILPHDLTTQQIDDAVVQAVKDGSALYQVDGDLLAHLNPDLIITQGVCDVCAVNQGTVEQTLLFLPDFVTSDVRILSLSGANFSGILRDIQLVAAATNTQTFAQDLINTAKQDWQTLSDTQPETKPKVAMIEWPDPFFYGGHWVPEMVEVAGGIDVLGQSGLASGRCTSHDIIQQDPDFIISIACGYDLDKNLEFAQMLAQNPEFSRLKAVQNNNVWAMDANSYCSRPTPRIVEGAKMLQAIFLNQAHDAAGVINAKTIGSSRV